MGGVWINFAVALSLGLFIGLERERKKGAGHSRKSAGIRTFGLAGLLGAIALYVGGNVLLCVVTSSVAIFAAISYRPSGEKDPGVTSEVALVITPLLGGLSMSNIPLAAALGVCVAGILAAKIPLHKFVRGLITDEEVTDVLTISTATLVVWPQLPNRYMGPWQTVNPHTVWLFVILVLALGLIGQLAGRIFGARIGLPIAGLISGFISSTATIVAMGVRASKDISILTPAVAGAALSTVATFVQMAVLLFAVSKPTFFKLTEPLMIGGLLAMAYGSVFFVRALKSIPGISTQRSTFDLKSALLLAGINSLMLIFVGGAQQLYGDTGLFLGAALSGLVDAHSAAISVASLVAAAKITPAEAVVPILSAMTANALMKSLVAVGVGNRRFALCIVPGLILSMSSAWAVAWLEGI